MNSLYKIINKIRKTTAYLIKDIVQFSVNIELIDLLV